MGSAEARLRQTNRRISNRVRSDQRPRRTETAISSSVAAAPAARSAQVEEDYRDAELRKAFALVDETIWRAFVGEDPGSKAAQEAYADAAHSLQRTMMYIERFSEIAITAANDRRSDHRGDEDPRRREVAAEDEDMLDPWRYLAEMEAHIKSGSQEAVTLGECRRCGGQVRVLRGKTGKRYAACVGEGWPGSAGGCGQTLPLLQWGTITATGQTCSACGWPQIRVAGASGRGQPQIRCVDIECTIWEKAWYRRRTEDKH